MNKNEKYIQLCFELARHGMGSVAPNPMVGAVVVKNGEVIGKGYHQKYGEPHAEPNAISSATQSVEGATLYCSLEPCCHTNKQTPPCTDLIIKSKIAKVVVSNLDPNPEVAGKGLEILRKNGIETEHGICSDEGEKLNEVFFKYITSKSPFVHLKMAQTLDGRIATATGDSKWITDEYARTIVHQMRYQYDAVMVGRGTLNSDNPSLDIRYIESNNKLPYRIVVGNPQEMDWNSKVLSDAHTCKTILVASPEQIECLDCKTRDYISDKSITLISASSLKQALLKIGEMKISSILLEGGSKLATSFVEQKLVDKISIFIAPKIIGNGPSSFEGTTFEKMDQAIQFRNIEVKSISNQVLIEGNL